MCGLDWGKIVHHLGFQRHLVSLENLHELEQISADSASLGLMTEMFGNVETSLRTAHALHVDAAVCKSAHPPGHEGNEPSGLDVEQLIQLVRFASHSANLSIVGFGVDEKATAEVIQFNWPNCTRAVSGIFWRVCTRAATQQLQHETLLSLISAITMRFLNLPTMKKAKKWWVRIQQDQESNFVACTATDHEEAVKGSLTSRIHRLLFELR